MTALSCTISPTTDQRCTAPYVVKGNGPKPKARASEALAKSLNVAKYTRLKPGELQHEVDIRRKFTVKGLWWGSECPEDETDH